MRQSRRGTIMFVILLAVTACRRDVVRSNEKIIDDHISRMGLEYIKPELPESLPQKVTPHPGSKLESWLGPGEMQVDLWENYRRSHLGGWRLAIRHWVFEGEFIIDTEELAFSWQANTPSGCEAFWAGYSKSRADIESFVEHSSQ